MAFVVSAIGGTGTAILGAGLLSAGASIYTSSKAAEAQKQAALAAGQSQVQAAQAASAAYTALANQALGYAQPYRDLGAQGATELGNRLKDLTKTNYTLPTTPVAPTLKEAPDGNFTQADLEATPGYQFTKQQGLKAVQNSAAARGLGVSGAALKGAATFATGLSDQTYNTRFQQQQDAYKTYLTEKAAQFGMSVEQYQAELAKIQAQQSLNTDAYNKLKGVVDTGTVASGQAADIAKGIGQVQAQAQTNIGQAQAGAVTGAAQATAAGLNTAGGAVNNAANNIAGYLAYKDIYGNNQNTNNPSPKFFGLG